MKTPRIILWDELPGAINQNLSKFWEVSPLAADGYQSEARTRSASFQASGSFGDQAPFKD
jgi:hypothetical protein